MSPKSLAITGLQQALAELKQARKRPHLQFRQLTEDMTEEEWSSGHWVKLTDRKDPDSIEGWRQHRDRFKIRPKKGEFWAPCDGEGFPR